MGQRPTWASMSREGHRERWDSGQDTQPEGKAGDPGITVKYSGKTVQGNPERHVGQDDAVMP